MSVIPIYRVYRPLISFDDIKASQTMRYNNSQYQAAGNSQVHTVQDCAK
jgi:hypothetical protein